MSVYGMDNEDKDVLEAISTMLEAPFTGDLYAPGHFRRAVDLIGTRLHNMISFFNKDRFNSFEPHMLRWYISRHKSETGDILMTFADTGAEPYMHPRVLLEILHVAKVIYDERQEAKLRSATAGTRRTYS